MSKRPPRATDKPRSKVALAIAWGATLLALALAVSDGLSALFYGTHAGYQPMVALTAVMVVALVWYTYFTRETLEHARSSLAFRRTLQRESVATAVLAELYGISERLRSLNTKGPSAGTKDFIAHPMLERAAADPGLFSAPTIHALATTLGRIRDVQEYLDTYPDLEHASRDQTLSLQQRQSAEDKRATTYLAVRARAGWGYNWVTRLVEHLEAEGGLKPAGISEEAVALLEDVKLLPDPFDRDVPPHARQTGA